MVEVIGHRGASSEAPENTLAANRLAFQQNADGIEIDVRLTKDHKLVCMHDKSTRRTADQELVIKEGDSKGTFKDLLAKLRASDLNSKLPTTPKALADKLRR